MDAVYNKYNKNYKRHIELINKISQNGGDPLMNTKLQELKNKLEPTLEQLIDDKIVKNFNVEPGTNNKVFKKDFPGENSIYLKKIDKLYKFSGTYPLSNDSAWNSPEHEFKWNNFKRSLTPKQMTFVSDLRKQIVDGILDKIFEAYSDCNIKIIQGIQEIKKNICIKTASGSDSTSGANSLSDYDLTITGHFQVSNIIAIFNSIMMIKFGSEPFNVFDTNLYGYSFLIPHGDRFSNNITWPLDDLESKYNYLRIKDQIKSHEQDIWAYRRLFTFFHELKPQNKYKIEMENTHQNNWCTSEKNNLEKLKDSEKASSYLEQMAKFEDLMNNFSDNKIKEDKKFHMPTNKVLDIKDVQSEMIDALSYMNYFGDETYFTQGCFVHVVGTMFYYRNLDMSQNGKPKLLTISQLIHSLVENLAYFLHAYDKKGIIVAVKYMQRFINAYHMIKIKKSEPVSKYLIDLEEFLDFIKLNIRNLSNGEIYEKLKNKSEHQEYFAKFGEQFMNNQNFAIVMEVFKKKISCELLSKFVNFIMSEGLSVINNFSNNDYYLYGLFELLRIVVSSNTDCTDLTISCDNGKYHVNITNVPNPVVHETAIQVVKNSIASILEFYKTQ